jgi:hypothetical protein
LELSGAWEPPSSLGPLSFGKGKETHLVFLMETKLQAHQMEKIRLCIGFENVLVINSVGRREGLALLWSSEVEVDI